MRALVTGGAGFIGSHVARRLLDQGHEVRILDDLSTGRQANLEVIPEAELVSGSVAQEDDVHAAMEAVDVVFHLAALPSVARSWTDPVRTLMVNGIGTANVLAAARAEGTEAVILSSSSSVYGDQPVEVKSEDLEPNPMSPYAASKLIGERLALAEAAGGVMRVVALRYFNVFGPRQDPDSPYSAVIPLFVKAALNHQPALIHGDGLQSRDFTYVDNVVQANLRAWQSRASGVAINVACGRSVDLLGLVRMIGERMGRPLEAVHGEPRKGDVKHSLASIDRARLLIGYEPEVMFEEGLDRTIESLTRELVR